MRKEEHVTGNWAGWNCHSERVFEARTHRNVTALSEKRSSRSQFQRRISGHQRRDSSFHSEWREWESLRM